MTETSGRLEAAYEFTNSWFVDVAKNGWDQIMPQLNPSRVLEIGSYEGASACYLIDTLSEHRNIEIHCVDNWEGGLEHKPGGAQETDMSAVERRFLHNINLAASKARNAVVLHCHKGASDIELTKLLADGKQGYFDFIYIDGSHQAPDVLCDAILSFRLLRVGGVIVFDDYLWAEQPQQGIDPLRCPKMAIDAFTNIYCRKTRILSAPLYQLYLQKISD